MAYREGSLTRMTVTLLERSLLPMLVVLLATTGSGCSTPTSGGFASLSTGMTSEEVRGLLGEPSVRVPAERLGDEETIAGPRWQYGDNLSSVVTAATYPRTVPDDVWIVWFDPDGRVICWREPLGGDPRSRPGTVGAGGRSSIFPDRIYPRER